MRYVTISELRDIIRRNLWKIPHDIDLVVGVPRSGMLPASMIALYLNKRLTDLDSFLEGRVMSCGNTGWWHDDGKPFSKILIVDDSIQFGRAIRDTKEKINKLSVDYKYVYLTPIASIEGGKMVDLFFEIIEGHRIFEWNLFHHPILQNSCMDIDGVLCKDPEEDDDGEIYRSFLQTAMPLYIPSRIVDTLISCRLEKYRSFTQDWLAKNGIKYNNLIMLDMPDRTSRIKWGKYGEFKGLYYKNSSNILFVESSCAQAEIIADVSQKPVICVSSNMLILKKQKIQFKTRVKNKLMRISPNIGNTIVEFYRKIKL